MTHTGEILRRRDGNYCFSCNHCDKYFDIIDEIVDHINKVLNDKADIKVSSKLDLLSYTEFVDVSVPVDVKCELVEDYFDAEHYRDAILDDNIELTEKKNVSDNNQSFVPVKRKPTANRDSSKGNDNGHERLMRPVKLDAGKYQINLECYDKTDLIKCCWCSEMFNNFGLATNHLTDEHNKKSSDVYSCDKCQLFFKNMNLLSDHILSRHGPDEHQQFRMQIDYQENSKPIQCIVCQLWTNGTKSFDAHTKEAHKMYRILQCYICGIFKKKPSGLLDHLKVHDRFRKYRCYECDNVEPKITNPNDSRSHKCVLCSVWFPSHAYMQKHLSDTHGQDQIYDCTICDDFTFKTEWDLKMHGISVHEIPSEYKCEICSKRCKSLQSFNEHQKNHLTTSVNVCPICGSIFRRKDYLIRHIKSHSEANKDFKCYICKKKFQNNGYLKNHIKRHTEKKMHQCHVCGNRFLLAGLLRKHMKEHEGEIWKCTQCPKDFSNKSKLTAHEKTHVTERNFRCDVSPKTNDIINVFTFTIKLSAFRFA